MQTIKHLLLWGAYALIAYMPFHIFLSQSLSLLTGGLSLWKIAKDVIIIGLAALSLFIVLRYNAWNRKYAILVAYTAVYGLLHLALYFSVKATSFEVAALATVYNVRILALFIIGVSVGLLFKKNNLSYFFKLAVIISTIVAMLGILQYFLPTDLLTNFGYSEARGAKPNFLIDNKADLPRIMSTIREPNSLGAYLVLPILFLFYKLVQRKRVLLFSGLLGVHILALLLTFSRSAWLALMISGSVFVFAQYGTVMQRFVGRHAIWIVATVILLSVGLYSFRDQYVVQNILFHSDENSLSELDSNEKHLISLDTATDKVTDHPYGHGPGTAGPVSMHTRDPFITENYYLQLAYEIGVAGLIMFISLCVAIFMYLKRINMPEARVLYAVFIGYVICNLFLHAWSNEAVATQWWVLAGAVLGTSMNAHILPIDTMTKAKRLS